MLFRREHIAPILEGRKTQTRRLWKRPMVKTGGVYWAQTGFCRPETRFARLLVVRVDQEPLGAISEYGAHAEGYPDRDAYLDAFCKINRINLAHVDLTQVVTCVEFLVVEEAANAKPFAMTPKTPAQPAAAQPLKPGQRVRVNWEIAKSSPCPCPLCGDSELGASRQRQEKDGQLPVFAVVLEEYHGQVFWGCCGQYSHIDGYRIEGEDGTNGIVLPEWLEAF